MADFTAVIQRAVDGLSDKSPEMRVKVYEKAKNAVQRQLNAMNPPPTEDMVSRQMQKLDAAIAEIEATFTMAPAAEEEVSAPQPEAAEETPEKQEPVSDAPAEKPEEVQEEPAPQQEEQSGEPEAEQEPEPEPQAAEGDEPKAASPEPEPEAIAEVSGDAEETGPSAEEEAPEEYIEETGGLTGTVKGGEIEYEGAPFPGAGAPLVEAELPDESEEPVEDAEEEATDELQVGSLSDYIPSDEELEASYGGEEPPYEGDEDPLYEQAWELPSIDDTQDDEVDDESFDAPVPEADAYATAEAEEIYDADTLSVDEDGPEEEYNEEAHYELDEPVTLQDRADIERIVSNLEENERGSDRSGMVRTAVLALLSLIVVAGLAFAGWQYRDDLGGLFGPSGTDVATPAESGDDGPVDTAQDAADNNGAETAQPEEKGIDKFNQRLLADGSEVEGEAGPAATGDEEGKSIAQQDGSSEAAGDEATETPAANAKAVKMFLYEERLGQASPTALEGTVEWTRQLETQDVGNPQPVIQAKIEVPERALSAMLTFKRNLDPSLPASHIIELVFSLPENFEGGGIENVVRISMKQNEQDQGSPLIGVPARITDYFHMLALNALPEAEKSNLELLKTRDWIDIPLVYGNGRRALITLEKGSEGKAVFDQVLKEWGQAASGQ